MSFSYGELVFPAESVEDRERASATPLLTSRAPMIQFRIKSEYIHEMMGTPS